jgi:hypothetical protein
VNKERRTPRKIELAVDGRRIEHFKVWEISADPELEMMELCTDALDPVERIVTDGNYTLPGAAVAVIEGELS